MVCWVLVGGQKKKVSSESTPLCVYLIEDVGDVAHSNRNGFVGEGDTLHVERDRC